MGIGRREFLKLSGIALAGLNTNSIQAVVTNEDVYVNKKLGIMFYKPNNWGFVSVKDFGELKDKQILANRSEEIKNEIWNDLGEPICIITKYYKESPENKGVFSPTITLNITPKKELESLGYDSFEELIALSELGTSLILKDFTVVKSYAPYQISGTTFYEYDAYYMFEHYEISEPLKVELKVLKAEHNDFYYDFNFHQSFAQNQIATSEFEEFKKTIKLI